jgi:Tat protein translocase TatB subunit
MDILGIGFPELILIFIIALMVFGPRRLPEIAAKVGKTVADLRNMSSGLLTEWQREIAVATRVEELEKTRQELDQIKQDLKQTQGELAAEASEQVKELKETRKELEKATQQSPRALKETSAEDTSSQAENAIKPPSDPPHPAPPAAPPAEAVSE